MTDIIVIVLGCLLVAGGLIWGIWYENSPASKEFKNKYNDREEVEKTNEID